MCRTIHALLTVIICGIQMLVRVFMTVILMIENVVRMFLQTLYNFISFLLQLISLIPICCVFFATSRLKCFMCGGGGPCPVQRGGGCDCLMSAVAIIILFFIFRATGVLDKIFYSIGYAKAAKHIAKYSPKPGTFTECTRNDTFINATISSPITTTTLLTTTTPITTTTLLTTTTPITTTPNDTIDNGLLRRMDDDDAQIIDDIQTNSTQTNDDNQADEDTQIIEDTQTNNTQTKDDAQADDDISIIDDTQTNNTETDDDTDNDDDSQTTQTADNDNLRMGLDGENRNSLANESLKPKENMKPNESKSTTSRNVIISTKDTDYDKSKLKELLGSTSISYYMV